MTLCSHIDRYQLVNERKLQQTIIGLLHLNSEKRDRQKSTHEP